MRKPSLSDRNVIGPQNGEPSGFEGRKDTRDDSRMHAFRHWEYGGLRIASTFRRWARQAPLAIRLRASEVRPR